MCAFWRAVSLVGVLTAAGLILPLSCSKDNPEKPDTQPPQVTITAPHDGDTLSAAPALIEVTATDNRGVARVDFYADTTLLDTDMVAPFAQAWVWSDLADDDFHLLHVTAVDHAGNAASDTISVYLPSPEPPDTVPPIVAITAPLDGAQLIGHPTITATATDTGVEGAGIASVSFYADGALLGTDIESPYEQLWDTSGLATGQAFELTAVAQDLAGNTAADTVHVMLLADEQAPDVAITTPPGSALSATESITASATDAGGVAAVRFFLGDELVGVDRGAPFEQPALALLYWADGASHEIAAEAEDHAGNTRRSDPVAVSITKPATAWMSQVLAVAGPGEASGHHFDRLVRLHPEVRYRGTQIDTITVNTCILGHSALIDYELRGCLYVMAVPWPATIRFHIDHCIVINASQPGHPYAWGGAVDFVSIGNWEPPYGQVTHCTIYASDRSGVYLHRSQADHLVIKNNLFVQNQLGGCVRYGDDVTPEIRYNCAFQNQTAQFGEHCGCPSSVYPDEIFITDPEQQLGTNITEDPAFPAITKPPYNRTRREQFVLGPNTPCRNHGEDGTYMGAMPPN